MRVKRLNINLTKSKLAIVLIAIIFSSCGSSVPSAEFAKEELNKNDKSPYELTDFKKTNGIEGKVDGKETYEMNFHAKLIARDSLYSYTEFNKDTIHVQKTNTKRLNSMVYSNAFKQTYWKKLPGFKKGEFVKEIDGIVRFVKTENGWEIHK